MAKVYWLSEAEWARIEPLLPRGRRGAHRVDDRRIISGIVHMLRSGSRWRDCPAAYGPYTTVYNRFNRWSRQGIWLGIFEALRWCPVAWCRSGSAAVLSGGLGRWRQAGTAPSLTMASSLSGAMVSR